MRLRMLLALLLAGMLSACATPPGSDAAAGETETPASGARTAETEVEPDVEPFEPARVEDLEPAEPAPAEQVLRADAESGRTYLYFGPEDFKGETKKYLSLSDTQSAEWLQKTLYRYLNLDRNRVRATARPGHAEVAISGTLTEEKLDVVIAEILKLRQRHEKLQPIKVICRVGDEDEAGDPGEAPGAAQPDPSPTSANEPAPRPAHEPEPGLFPRPKELPAGEGVRPAFPL